MRHPWFMQFAHAIGAIALIGFTALGNAQARTGDIRGKGNTASFTQAVLRNLRK